MKFIRDMFSEDSDISIMRVMSVLGLLIGGVLAFKGHDSAVVSIFVYAAFGGKAVQKMFEVKAAEEKPKEENK